MNASTERLEFAPPPERAAVRGFVLAIIAHILLMLALTWGINWKRESDSTAAEAELWAAVPQQAAPEVVQPPPAPIPPAVVQAPPLPPPTPVEKIEPPPPVAQEPDIAMEREKKRRAEAQRRQEELERQKKIDAQKKKAELEREKKDEVKRQAVAQQKAAEEAKRREEQAKVAKDKARQQLEDKKTAALRQQQMDRIRKMAGAAESPNPSAGSGQPSAGYAGRIAARIKPHIRHPQDVPGNPPVEVEVRTSPDGTIVGQRVVKSSGNAAWDESALRAVIATGSLPRNEEGRVPSAITLSIRQRD